MIRNRREYEKYLILFLVMKCFLYLWFYLIKEGLESLFIGSGKNVLDRIGRRG